MIIRIRTRRPSLPKLSAEATARVAVRVGSWLYGIRRRIATVALALLAILVGYNSIFGANGIIIYQNKKDEYRRLNEEIDSLKKQNADAAADVQALRTDPKAIEKEAREQLRYTRPGEIIYVMPGEKK